MSKLAPELFKTTPEERIRIKRRTKQLVTLAGGPEVFQHAAGVPKDMLSKYGSVTEANFINASVIVALDRELGTPLMVGELAAILGYRLVPIDDEHCGDDVTIRDVAELNRAASDVSSGLAEALEDGVIDMAESRNARASIARKIAKLHRVDRKLARAR